jgi:hypothetical protein
MKFQILMVSITLGLILFPNIVSGQLTGQQLEVVKLEREIELLNQQIKSSDPLNILYYTQLIPIVGGILLAGAGAFFAWQRERRIPPPAEQEKIFENIVKQWYSRSYLLIYSKIWSEIQELENDSEYLVDHYYEILSRKPFDWHKFPEEIKKKVEDDPKEYLKKKLHLNDKEIDIRIKAVINNADVEYYDDVQKILPSVIDNAVTSAIGNPTNLDEIDYEVLVENSLKATKRLMIFYTLAEDKKVVEILIRAKVCEKMQGWKKSNCYVG